MKKPVAVAVLLLGLLLVLGLLRGEWSSEAPRGEPPGAAAVESTGMPAGTGTAAASSPMPPRLPDRVPDRMPGPESVEAAKAARIAQLEDKVAAEPVSAQWAAENTQRIQSFLAEDSLRAAQLPSVDHSAVDCRTTICRIELRTQDSLGAGELTQGILQTVAGQMSAAQIFESEGPGGTTLLIFSSVAPASEGAPFRTGR